MKKRSAISCIFAFLISVTLAIGCTQTTTPTSSSGNDAKTTPTSSESTAASSGGNDAKMGFSAWPGWFPWQVAQDEGIFKASNLTVDLKWFDGYLESLSALAAGQLDANGQTLNDTLSAVAKGAEQVIVLTNDNSTGNDQLIVSEGIKSVADLKGKKVAAEEGTVDHYMLLLALKKAGLSVKDIQFVPLETGQAATAFVAKKVDAAAVFAPFTTNAIKRPGSKVLLTSKDFPGAISDHLVVNKKFLDQHPEKVQAMVDAWFATLDYIAKNPDKANAIMTKRAGVTLAEYKDYANGTQIFSVADNLKAFAEGKDRTSLKVNAEEISNFLVEAKLAEKKPDISKLFDDRFVKAYAAKAKPA
jgi:NitT/TauT family transport system substrate-binding protein